MKQKNGLILLPNYAMQPQNVVSSDGIVVAQFTTI